MSVEEFAGERYLPGVIGEIAYEHCHRYAFARRLVQGRRVLDAACGEGYGSALLAEVAHSVLGVDIDSRIVEQATARYAGPTIAFETASVTRLPVADASVDAVVSFETIEHLNAEEQAPMLAEFARVLAPDGLLILSSPNRVEYSDARGYVNPFHLRELDRAELAGLLQRHFAAQRWFRQRRYLGSAIWAEASGERFEALSGSPESIAQATVPHAMYFVVVAARMPDALPADAPALSLYADSDDAEWARVDHEAREVLRLDALARARDEDSRLYAAQLQAVTAELQSVMADRERVIAERARAWREALDDANRAAAEERERLSRQIEAQERVVTYRESVRWWFVLPLLRARRLWHRIRAA
jgi:ubiquinone/menaquinone biosynthesis C-methylase UbiE